MPAGIKINQITAGRVVSCSEMTLSLARILTIASNGWNPNCSLLQSTLGSIFFAMPFYRITFISFFFGQGLML